jgi:GNAT superfamily N-acetyltransferase
MSNIKNIRPYLPEDEPEVVRVWVSSGKATYDFIPWWETCTEQSATPFFKNEIVRKNQLWVAVGELRIEAYIAMQGNYIDQLFVAADSFRKGWGMALLNLAKALSPKGLELHTHQKNVGACAFYEKNGFVAVEFGVTPPPESEPDVKYAWSGV